MAPGTSLTLTLLDGNQVTLFLQVNRQEKGHDANVSGVWQKGVNGAGVTVAVVDDGRPVMYLRLLGDALFCRGGEKEP